MKVKVVVSETPIRQTQLFACGSLFKIGEYDSICMLSIPESNKLAMITLDGGNRYFEAADAPYGSVPYGRTNEWTLDELRHMFDTNVKFEPFYGSVEIFSREN